MHINDILTTVLKQKQQQQQHHAHSVNDASFL